jgi:hypothetical protein
MLIVTEKKIPKKEASNNSEWDITWKEALGVFKALSGQKITFWDADFDRKPLGKQPITGLKIQGNDLHIYGTQTGYIIFGDKVSRVVRTHHDSPKVEKMTLIFSPYRALELSWTS